MNIKKTSIILAIHSFFILPLVGFSSDLLEKKSDQTEIRTYYYRHLNNLKKAVPPRRINFIDTRNVKQYGSMGVEGILFTYQNIHVKNVSLVTDFDKYKKHPMIRNHHGVFYLIYIPNEYILSQDRKVLKYKYYADGMYHHDGTHENTTNDGANDLISLYYLNETDVKAKEGAMRAMVSEKRGDKFASKTFFRVYAPDADEISVVGSFNFWNPDLDIMTKKENGYHEYTKKLPPGEYIYLLKVDGKYQLDAKNRELRSHAIYGRTNYLRIGNK